MKKYKATKRSNIHSEEEVKVTKASFVAVTPNLLLPLLQVDNLFYFVNKKQNTNLGIDCTLPFVSLEDALKYAEKVVRIFCLDTLADIYEEDNVMGAVAPKMSIRNNI